MTRATIGNNLDVNMLRYQEAPMIPRGGYHKPQEISIRQGPPKQRAPITNSRSHHPLKYNSDEERKEARSLRVQDTNKRRLAMLFANRTEVTKLDAMRILGMNNENSARHFLKRLEKAKLVTDSGIYKDGMMVFIPYVPGYIKPSISKQIKATMGKSRDDYNKRQRLLGIEASKRRLSKCYGNDEVMSTNMIADREGLSRPAALNLVKDWVKKGLVTFEAVLDKGQKSWRIVK